MRNRFAGQCYRCGGTVEAGEGHFERARPDRLRALGVRVLTAADKMKGRWLTQHALCAIEHRGTDASIWRAGA